MLNTKRLIKQHAIVLTN